MNRPNSLHLFLFLVVSAIPISAAAVQKCIDANGDVLYSRNCPVGYTSVGSLDKKGNFEENMDATNSNSPSTNEKGSKAPDHIISGGRSGGGGSSGGIVSETANKDTAGTKSTKTTSTDTTSTGTPTTETAGTHTIITGIPITEATSADTTSTETPIKEATSSDTTSTVTITDPTPSEPDLSSSYLSVTVQPKGTKYSLSTLERHPAVQEIIINGSNFGSGPNIELYDTFSNGVSGEVIPLISSGNPACRTDIDPRNTLNDTGPRIGCWSKYGTYRAIYGDQGYSDSSSMLAMNGLKVLNLFKTFDKPVTEVFISFRALVPRGTYFPGTQEVKKFAEVSTWKFSWLMDHENHDNSYPNLNLPAYAGGTKFAIIGNDSPYIVWLDGHDFWSWDYWNSMSVWVRANTDDPLEPGDIIFQNTARDMGVFWKRALIPVFDEDGPEVKQYTVIDFPGYIKVKQGTTEYTENIRPLYDDIYIATGTNSVSRVELSDSPTYVNSGQLEIQIPLAWSDSRIRLPADGINLRKFENGKLYLYITDTEGNYNLEGIDLSPLFEG